MAVRASEPIEDAPVVAAPSVVDAAPAVLAAGTSEFDSDDGPRWPDDATEASFLAEQKNGPPAVTAKTATPPPTVEAVETEIPLPNLQSLVDRIPGDAKATLDELFRARFVSVKRIRGGILK